VLPLKHINLNHKALIITGFQSANDSYGVNAAYVKLVVLVQDRGTVKVAAVLALGDDCLNLIMKPKTR